MIFLFDFTSVWGGILGGILVGIARAGFSHRESALPDQKRSDPLKPAYLCSLAYGVITRRIPKWTQGRDVVGPACGGLYGSSVLV